ncbi:5696_t:CDS:2 [Paraglomus brasilianum]|uniref:5696_t:CDS:1 n=1 Tax=Paraglomus brasilianum TaxID=144538 RepID=A0A9N8WIS3_9GLOM|nr:5696_t:CDS:2 [Paraglomus brasilianum]
MNKRSENTSPIGREPHSGVVFHALPRHDTISDPSPDELDNDETRWQDVEHVVTPPAHREIVGRLQKDWEKETKEKNAEKEEDKNKDEERP